MSLLNIQSHQITSLLSASIFLKVKSEVLASACKSSTASAPQHISALTTSHCHGNTFTTALLTSARGLPHSFDLGTLLINTLESLSNPHMTKLKPLA